MAPHNNNNGQITQNTTTVANKSLKMRANQASFLIFGSKLNEAPH